MKISKSFKIYIHIIIAFFFSQYLYADIDLSKTKVGIWSRVVKLRDSVSDGDRIEIYRPLIADPKEIRKRRAEKAKEEGRADKVTGGRVNPLKAKESQGEK